MLATLKSRLGSSSGRLIGNWSIYTLGGFLSQGLSFFLLPVFTRYLSPHDYGVLSYTAMLRTFFTILGSLSIQTYVIRHYYDCKTAKETRQLFGTILIFVFVYNLCLLGAAYLTLPIAFRVFNVQVPFAPYVQLVLLGTVIEIIGLIPMSYFRATEQAGKYVVLALTMTLLSGGLSVYLIVGRGMGLLGRYYGQLGADVALLIVYLMIMARISDLSWNSAHVRKAIAFCSPLVPAQFLASFTNMSDRLILERYVPLAHLGIYSVGFALASIVALLAGQGLYTAIQPQVCRLASESRLDARIMPIKRYVLLLLAGIVCSVIALSREIVAILAPPTFRESYKIASLLVVSIAMQAFLTLVPSLYLMANKKTQYEPPIRLAGAVVGLVAMLVLVPWWGIYGAAISTIIAALATLYAYQLVLRRQSCVRWAFSRDVALMGGACLLGYGILQTEMPLVALTVAIKLSLITVLAGVYILRMTGRIRGLKPIIDSANLKQ